MRERLKPLPSRWCGVEFNAANEQIFMIVEHECSQTTSDPFTLTGRQYSTSCHKHATEESIVGLAGFVGWLAYSQAYFQ